MNSQRKQRSQREYKSKIDLETKRENSLIIQAASKVHLIRPGFIKIKIKVFQVVIPITHKFLKI